MCDCALEEGYGNSNNNNNDKWGRKRRRLPPTLTKFVKNIFQRLLRRSAKLGHSKQIVNYDVASVEIIIFHSWANIFDVFECLLWRQFSDISIAAKYCIIFLYVKTCSWWYKTYFGESSIKFVLVSEPAMLCYFKANQYSTTVFALKMPIHVALV